MEMEIAKDPKTGVQHQTRLSLRMSSRCQHRGTNPELGGLLAERPWLSYSGLSQPQGPPFPCRDDEAEWYQAQMKLVQTGTLVALTGPWSLVSTFRV